MPTPIWSVELVGGKLVFDAPAQFKAWIQGQCKPGRYRLILQRETVRRGSGANRYYHGVCIKLLADHLGHDCEDLHYEMRRKFLVIDPDATVIQTRSTAELDRAEFARYVDDVRRFAATMGCSIPDPNEVE